MAAAAEAAGFRACLRCRPYRWEPAPASGTPGLVSRALSLVLDGALDSGTEARLGARLGVSPRHLRRLFEAHLGVSPDQLARSRRAHFARRLLDDSDLSVTEIAFASGFGSVRQMNRAFLQIFRAAPTELRRRRRASDRLAADGGLPIRLAVDGPLAWNQMLGFMAQRAIPGVESVFDGVYRRTVVVDGDPGVLELLRDRDDSVLLRAHLPHWEGMVAITRRARRVFNLDADVSSAQLQLGTDPLIGPLIAARPGLRPPGCWDAFEIGIRAIVGQQVSVKAATTVIGRIVERYGNPVPGLVPMGLSRVFPTPGQLAQAELEGVGLPTTRAAAIRRFSLAVEDHQVHLDRACGLDELVEEICALPGLGPWTAHYLALRIGERDAFPASDLGLRRALAPAGVRSAPAAAEVAKVAERWRPYRAFAAAHLWSGPGTT